MSITIRSARITRRRRFSPAGIIESLEARELPAVAAAMSPLAHVVDMATDLHAQALRLQQLDQVQHAASRVTVAAVTSTSAHLATVKHATAQARINATAAHHGFNDLIVRRLPATTSSGAGALTTYAPILGAYTPTQVRTAYGVSTLGSGNLGQGTTIAIIDEFDDPNIAADTAAYNSQYNLPQFDGLNGDPTLTVYKDQALAPVTSAVNTGVAGETSLDVQLAHAMAPLANILLVEVPATGSNANAFAELLHGVQYAAAQPGVVVVSLSYGGSERGIGTSLASLDNTYLATGAATNVPITVSTGDSSSPSYPASSPEVVAVGGTSLYLASVRGKYGYESAWGGQAGAGAGGGGLSTNFAAPTYQTSNGVNYGKRSIPDVSLVADPYTGVSFYDSLDETTQYPSPWGDTGGTSVAAPVFAGMLDLAQQDRLAAGKMLLNSAQIDSTIYSLYNSTSYLTYFHDIAQGNNSNVTSSGRTTVAGYTATTGYDLATGVGSPIGSTFVPYLTSL